jgi:hypothetical protein
MARGAVRRSCAAYTCRPHSPTKHTYIILAYLFLDCIWEGS